MVNPNARVSTDWNEYLNALNNGQVGRPYRGPDWVDSTGNFLVGKDEEISKLFRYEPDVRQQLSLLRQQAMSGLNRDVTGDYDRSMRQQWQKNTLPTIMSRLSSAGLMSSPDINRLLAQSGAQFEMGLGADKQRMQQEHEMMALKKFQTGAPQEFDTRIQPETEGFMQKLPGLIASVLTAYYTGIPLNLMGGQGTQQQQSQIIPQSQFNNSQDWQAGFQAPSMLGGASMANINAIFNKLLNKREEY